MSFVLGNTIDTVINNARDITATLGKAGLHAGAPDNFEYYMCSIELLDSMGSTKAFMNFAVMPNSISESKTELMSITKTNRGVVTLFNSSFIPRDISIQGTFGRKVRMLLIENKEIANSDKVNNPLGGNLGFRIDGEKETVLVKTGYGLTKMLKGIIDANYSLDSFNKPHILIFNNYVFNTHYVVEVLQSTFMQDVENNALWYYSLEMKAVAPASAVRRLDGEQDQTKRFLTSVKSQLMAKVIRNSLDSALKSGEYIGNFVKDGLKDWGEFFLEEIKK